MAQDKIEIRNLVPKFLDFYNRAAGCGEEQRFELWKEHYGFAAVPPGEEGMRLAKRQLDAAWDRYEGVIPFLEKWTPDSEKIRQYLERIKAALGYDTPMDVVLLFFVGAFDENAFAAPCGENRVAVCLPVESGENRITMVHELTHLVHGMLTGSAMRFERSVASLVLMEGLALHLSRELLLGHRDEEYLGEQQAGWLQECGREAREILQGIKPYLSECSPQRLFQFTMGTGTTGKAREGYFAGWKLVGDMLKNGWTFPDIARIRDESMADVLAKYI